MPPPPQKPPPSHHLFRERKIKTSLFRKYYLRGDIPIGRAFEKKAKCGQMLTWKTKPCDLDYAHYLPLFFDGLCESKFPYREFATHGVHDMLNVGGDKILPVIPQLIIPIKNALNTRNREVLKQTCRAIQHLLVTGPCIGEALVPYYRQILPMFNLFRDDNVNLGDKIDYNRSGHLGDLINETLQMLERYGGPDAYINIKYMVPTYESYVLN